MDESRFSHALKFLRAAVYRSRASQAAATALRKSAAPSTTNCGLGEKAALVLDLDARGREIFERLWQADPGEHGLERIREVLAQWVVDQDALDRTRNHFLKAFRQKHGFDRTRYLPVETAEFEAGLARVNEEEDRARRAAAERLLAVEPG